LKSLDTLIELKIERVLSSGGLTDAWSGREKLRELVQHAAGRIGVVPAGNVRVEHARELADLTGARELHSSTWFRLEPVASR
jgi:copper homeostasis protein